MQDESHFPKNGLERDLVALLQRHLLVADISSSDNFFELGGHSLSALQVSADIERTFGVRYLLQDLRGSPKIEHIARQIEVRRSMRTSESALAGELNATTTQSSHRLDTADIQLKDGEAVGRGKLSSMRRHESFWAGLKNRLFQILALYAPGMSTWRVRLHRARGVRLGNRVMIGTDVLIDTSCPHLVSIGSNVQIGIRTVLIAHFGDMTPSGPDARPTIQVQDDVYIGPGVTILPNVTIGTGSVVTAGSVVSQSVPAGTVVQGNPARPVARCTTPLAWRSYKAFVQGLSPITSIAPEFRKNRPSMK